MNKPEFLQQQYVSLLKNIDPSTPPVFGKMNVHQMIEHMGWAFRQASGLIPQPNVANEEVTQKMYAFMMSDRPFKDNTPNPYMPETPAPPLSEHCEAAIVSLEKDIAFFFKTFATDPQLRIQNPFFGLLNFEEWVHLLHKHAWHHLRQFGVNP